MRQKFKKWFVGLSRTSKILLIAAGVVVFGAAVGGGDANDAKQPIEAQNTAAVKQQDASQAQQKEPVVTVEEQTVQEQIAYQKQTQETASLNKGETRIVQAGQQGTLTKTFKVTKSDGVETSRELTGEVISKQPVAEITQIGTYVAPKPAASACDANYSGCVPVASDVDCAGGTGDGPAYANGPIRVIGYDKYRLDRDGDGIACDS